MKTMIGQHGLKLGAKITFPMEEIFGPCYLDDNGDFEVISIHGNSFTIIRSSNDWVRNMVRQWLYKIRSGRQD